MENIQQLTGVLRVAGCDDYDTKSVEPKRLLGKMEALLDRGVMEAEINGGQQR